MQSTQPNHWIFTTPNATTSPCIADSLPIEPKPLQRSQIERAPRNSPITGTVLVARVNLRSDRNGRQFVALTVQCSDGSSVEARWWNFPYPASECPEQGSVYSITAHVDEFNGDRQLRIIRADLVVDADLTAFVRSTRRALSELLAEYDAVCLGLDEPMQALVQAMLSDNVFSGFCTWPAAHHRHGAVRHGLLAHSLRVAELVQRIADAYGVDGLPCDRSLAVTAALLHDIGKLQTLPAIAGTAIPTYADYFDHVTLGVLMIRAAADQLSVPLPADRLDNLLHAILAHHGRQEWGAACEPHTVEAWLLHLADLAESRLWAFSNEEQSPTTSPDSHVQSDSARRPDMATSHSMIV